MQNSRLSSGKKYLITSNPELAKEWLYSKNGNLTPHNVTYGSHKKVWWICNKCNHVWKTFVFNRGCYGHSCPACSGRVATREKNVASEYPMIASEWDYELNSDTPSDVRPGSERKVWWACKKCGHKWKSLVFNRTLRGKGCPVCANQKVVEKNSFEYLYPVLLREWDFKKNNIIPSEVVPGSSKKVWWVCSVCKYNWKTSISHRTRNSPTGCPACAGRVVTKNNNITITHNYLLNTWDYRKNKIPPENVTFGSSKRIWWLCDVCGHSWKAAVFNRSNGRGCPKCARGNTSLVSQKWLDSLNIEIREHFIKDLGIRVDGFDPETNTVYEFLGDYWHGNPKIYCASEINPTSKKSFGKLYEETFDRFSILKKAGFKVIYTWEKDFIDFWKGVENGKGYTKKY